MPFWRKLFPVQRDKKPKPDRTAKSDIDFGGLIDPSLLVDPVFDDDIPDVSDLDLDELGLDKLRSGNDDDELEVTLTEADWKDPELLAELRDLGWPDDEPEVPPSAKEVRLQSLLQRIAEHKSQAVRLSKAGEKAEALEQLRAAKALEAEMRVIEQTPEEAFAEKVVPVDVPAPSEPVPAVDRHALEELDTRIAETKRVAVQLSKEGRKAEALEQLRSARALQSERDALAALC
eukprot:TRINITY_DN82117_c0_g1_i1.p1 TRINITY_DN82117_c0_g1~~TRINITY_DN82117_c0_g1_i1.p1  ORF type:complete len:233 (-),score=50.77 TRINITY_DN82117_c0_g1_i1:72-770(-)